MEHNMVNIIKKIKCPFLEANRFCTHKYNGLETNFKRSSCGYKNCINCDMFLEWAMNIYELNKITPQNGS